ncbi:type II toxin-antitoxin system VapC family toxin [Longimicrobium sp.]|uniref:type II toxin-antitoxin system VapC family toxin n=1 Tax=Longimicrobium sp. TaxID=2029185 RepID=UPI002C7E058A|nr:type II toxin-antitoxin system VapC family toxin [Longimicrobium sp.]HSU17389.1 type II toxin-antitoxin system VapC family toxin [Longimicrobium sp.]
MRKFVLDTGLLVRAFRSHEEFQRLKTFFSASVVYLSSVAAQELLSGARPHELRHLDRVFLEPFEKLKRVATPSHQGWRTAGDVLRKLRLEGYQITPSLTNDALIAVSATEVGATLVHDNQRDYVAIQRYYPRLRHTRSWSAFLN